MARFSLTYVNVRSRKPQQRGYTLIELLTVVIIVGVLATLAVYGVRKYMLAAKSTEALTMIGDIKAAEEAFRDETFNYAGLDDFDTWHPVATPGAFKTDWNGGGNEMATIFRKLGVISDSPVYFTYTVVAGRSGDSVPELPTDKQDFNFPSPATEPFYVVVAKGDLDGDGVFSYAMAHSLHSDVYVEHEGE